MQSSVGNIDVFEVYMITCFIYLDLYVDKHKLWLTFYSIAKLNIIIALWFMDYEIGNGIDWVLESVLI